MGGKQYGVPISREVLEKGFIRPGYRYRRTEFNTVASPAIAGARKLAARPQAAQSVQRQALTRVQGSALGMSVRLKVVDDTSTPNFSDRDPRREDRGQIRSNRRDTSGLPDKQRFPTSTSRIDNSFHIRTLKNENMSNRFSRADKTARPPDRNRSGRPRASPSRGDEREPGRRKRDAGGGSSDGYNKFDRKLVWTEEEKQYLEEKKKKESPQMLPFEPVDVNRQTFSGSGPAIAMGEWGMNEALRERLLLAKKHLVGESIQWDSKEQKAEVMTLVEKLRVVKRTEPAGKKEAEDGKVSPPSDSDLHTEALMQKLFGGIYGKFRPLGQKDVLGHVERYVHRNESYFPDDEISLLDKVRRILPAE